jgi:hypothetical protein
MPHSLITDQKEEICNEYGYLEIPQSGSVADTRELSITCRARVSHEDGYDKTPCNLLEVNRRFCVINRLYLQRLNKEPSAKPPAWRVTSQCSSRSSSQHCLTLAGFLVIIRGTLSQFLQRILRTCLRGQELYPVKGSDSDRHILSPENCVACCCCDVVGSSVTFSNSSDT